MNILFFGDSITWGAWDEDGGWVNRIKKIVDKKIISSNFGYYHDIYNIGISGDNTNDLLERFDSETLSRVDEDNQTIFVFAIGINDSQFVKEIGNRIPVDQFENNLRKLVIKARSHGDKIIFVGLFPTDDSKTDPTIWDSNKSYKLEYVSQYNKIIEKVAKDESLEFIDIYNEFISKNYKELLIDGLHPNTEGHKQISEIISKYLVDKKYI